MKPSCESILRVFLFYPCSIFFHLKTITQRFVSEQRKRQFEIGLVGNRKPFKTNSAIIQSYVILLFLCPYLCCYNDIKSYIIDLNISRKWLGTMPSLPSSAVPWSISRVFDGGKGNGTEPKLHTGMEKARRVDARGTAGNHWGKWSTPYEWIVLNLKRTWRHR